MPQIDYAALAAKHGGKPATVAPATTPAPAIDYAALAAKHGGKAADAQPVTAQAAPPEQPSFIDRAGDVAEKVAHGAEDFVLGGMYRAGVGNTLYNAARLATKMTPGVPALPERPDIFAPRNDAEKAGQMLEQTAEFFAPGGLVKAGAAKAAAVAPRLATAVRAGLEAMSAGSVAALQGGNAAPAAVMGAVGPVVGRVAEGLVPELRAGAAKRVEQALGGRKERYKAMAARLTPEVLKRGLVGSHQSLLAKASDAAEAAGQKVDDALQLYADKRIGTQPIVDALESAKDAFRATTAKGEAVVFEPRAIKQLEGLQKIIADLGPNADVTNLVAIRRAWDRVVDQAGGYAQRAGGAIGVPLKDQSEAWAKREATGAIRKLLADEVPDLAAVNKEFAFWKGLEDVLTQPVQRTNPQSGGLLKRGAEVAGAAAGASHGLGTAVLTGKLAGVAQSVITSPRFRLLSAQMRNDLADAIASGATSRITGQLNRAAAALAARTPQSAAAQ